MIRDTVAKGNVDKKQGLVRKNAQYLESFVTNNHEEEYQLYVSTLKNKGEE